MEEDIKYIQNTFWFAYKTYSQNKNIKEYNGQIQMLSKKYKYKPVQFVFCQLLLIAWGVVLEEIGGKSLRIKCEIDVEKLEKILSENGGNK